MSGLDENQDPTFFCCFSTVVRKFCILLQKSPFTRLRTFFLRFWGHARKKFFQGQYSELFWQKNRSFRAFGAKAS